MCLLLSAGISVMLRSGTRQDNTIPEQQDLIALLGRSFCTGSGEPQLLLSLVVTERAMQRRGCVTHTPRHLRNAHTHTHLDTSDMHTHTPRHLKHANTHSRTHRHLRDVHTSRTHTYTRTRAHTFAHIDTSDPYTCTR